MASTCNRTPSSSTRVAKRSSGECSRRDQRRHTSRSADCSAASRSTFARDSMFEIAVETCSANCVTRCSIPGGNPTGGDPTAMAPQVRPSTTIGPAAAARIPVVEYGGGNRTGHLRVVVDAARAAGEKHLVRRCLRRGRAMLVPADSRSLGMPRAARIVAVPSGSNLAVRTIRSAPRTRLSVGNEGEYPLRRRLVSDELGDRRSASCSAASRSTLARDDVEIAVETSSVNCATRCSAPAGYTPVEPEFTVIAPTAARQQRSDLPRPTPHPTCA